MCHMALSAGVRRWAAVGGATVTLAMVSGAPAGASSEPTARGFDGLAPVGALFSRFSSGRLGVHFCSGSVVNSPGGDLVITAAHCMDGRGPGQVAFIPGYHDGHAPYGVWVVTGVSRDVLWASQANPDHDMAFLTVRRPGTAATVQELTGAEGLSLSQTGERVETVGYPDRARDPVGCVNTLLAFDIGQLEFDCGGFPDGTSGGPLLADVNPVTGLGLIVGVIGGYQQGGDTPDVSYAARFGHQVAALYDRVVGTSAHSHPIERVDGANDP
jgi:V8-like Glu-specific endopeptidase